MKKEKLEKGITLIALIITIIILLILAVVTIGSIKNSNIITHAENAATEYNIKKDEEVLKLAIMETQLAGKGVFSYETLDANLPDGFDGANGRYTSKTGNIFEVDKKGNVEVINNLIDTNLRMNTKYYISGKEESEGYFIFYSDGHLDYVMCFEDGSEELAHRANYTIEDDLVKISALDFHTDDSSVLDEESLEYFKNKYIEITIIKEKGNDILILNDEISRSIRLYSINSNVLIYFNGEKYKNGDNYIILGSEEVIIRIKPETRILPVPPVLYNNVIYFGENQVITSNDNFETIIYDGVTYTKSVD